ncbi:MAG: T9SS type A sorting domain-containing protein [Bacteroidales bacterium]|jgi:endonuclease/exonuclease/phosphatase family metal-dependent hydrolase|nr:T9SS type A sorting domain-containing protein [Bacteroidales bacterium]
MNVKRFFLVSIVLISIYAKAQDTLKVMHYNLLYYGKNTSYCTSVNNAVDAKNGYLKTIIKYVKPDIFSVNELDGNNSYPMTDDATYLLNNALNVDGVDYYSRTPFPQTYLANTIFYNSQKLKLKKHTPISFNISTDKVYNVYTFYYNAPDLATTNDTAFVTCIVAHFKAGSYSEDVQERVVEAGIVMDYLTDLGIPGNYLFMGDLNLYTSSEGAFQKLINPSNSLYKFYDPANQIGDWNNNYNYRFVHTQSTHVSGDCHAGGGMDDRFDFILASDYIMNGTQKVAFVSGSYKAIGQDGNAFNSSINISTNTSVPSSVAQALYNMSDHLPVYLELKVDQTSVSELNVSNINTNPITPNSLSTTTVFATITDSQNKVNQVRIIWGNTSGNYSNRIVMSAAGNTYSGIISQFPIGTEIYFKIAGYDISDNIILLSDEYHFTIADPMSTEFAYNGFENIAITNLVQDNISISGKLLKSTNIKIELINLQGEIVLEQADYKQQGGFMDQISVQHIASGFYVIRLSTDMGYYSQKIIIQ